MFFFLTVGCRHQEDEEARGDAAACKSKFDESNASFASVLLGSMTLADARERSMGSSHLDAADKTVGYINVVGGFFVFKCTIPRLVSGSFTGGSFNTWQCERAFRGVIRRGHQLFEGEAGAGRATCQSCKETPDAAAGASSSTSSHSP